MGAHSPLIDPYQSFHPKTPLPHGRDREGRCFTPLEWIIMRRIGYRLPLGLMIRPAARVIRELPPSLAAYRVAVSFRAAPLAAPTFVRSTAGVENKKAVKSDPGGSIQSLLVTRPPLTGSGSGLTAHLHQLPRLAMIEFWDMSHFLSTRLETDLPIRMLIRH